MEYKVGVICGDGIVTVAGVPVGSGGTNTMRIRTVK